MTNPLTQYFRNPELFIRLPSEGRWWPDGSLEMTPSGELAVASMSGMDDLALRNADGLMNGETTVSVIQSCCKNIKDAWQMPSVDVDALFMAIRIASYGHRMDIKSTCSNPECKHELEFSVDLREIMARTQIPNYDNPVVLGPLTIFLKPASYKIMNINSQEVYQQQRAILLLRDQNLTQDVKDKIIKDALQRLTEITVNRMHEFVDRIVTEDNKIVTDPTFIKEFISNADRSTFAQLKEAIDDKNAEYKIPRIPVKCEECGHEEEKEVQFDPANFFGQDS